MTKDLSLLIIKIGEKIEERDLKLASQIKETYDRFNKIHKS